MKLKMAQRLNGNWNKLRNALKRPKSRMAAGALALLLIATIVAPVLYYSRADAYVDFVQNDWSGGVGANPINQYASADNITDGSTLTVGNTAGVAWCATSECSSSWTYRKMIQFNTLSNGVPSYTNETVKINVSYDAAMQADFDDLRFTNETGDQDVPYWVQSKTDGVSAVVYVKVADIPYGLSRIAMYFGNTGASSLSTKSIVDLQDNFSDGVLGPQWGGTNATLSGDTVRLHAYDNLPTTGQYTTGQESVLEFDVQIDGSQYDCRGASDFNTDGFGMNGRIQFNSYADHRCNRNTGVSSSMGVQFDYANSAMASALDFNYNTWYRFKIVRSVVERTNGQWPSYHYNTHYFSTDGGQTYTKITGLDLPMQYGDTDYIYFNMSGANAEKLIRNVVAYHSALGVTAQAGVTEEYNGYAGTLNSAAIPLPSGAHFGKIFLGYSDGQAGVKIRTANQSDMSDAADFATCNTLYDEQDIQNSSCVTTGKAYMQYQIMLTTNNARDAEFTSITLQYDSDVTAPSSITGLTMKTSVNGFTVADGGWVQDRPYFSWDASTDENGGSGLAGYCLYLGQDSSPSLTQTGGMLSNSTTSPIQTSCAYARAGTSLDKQEFNNFSLNNGDTYYFVVAPVDNLGNIGASSTLTLKADTQHPEVRTIFSFPSGTLGSKNFTVSWIGPPLGSLYDSASGVAGLKYCIAKYTGEGGIDPDDYCDPSAPNWFGADKTKGYANVSTNTIPFSASRIDVGPEAAGELDDGSDGGAFGNGIGFNIIYVAAIDNVGNARAGDGSAGYIFITQNPPSVPRNLQASPISSAQNNFSFSWSPPETFTGPLNQMDYCYSINTPIAANGSNCHWTGAGITQLAAGAYATQQGTNTLYVMAKDQTGNFSSNNAASVTFTANTSAPGAPADMDLADVSSRATSSWKLASSWSAPTQPGSGVASYKIYRSTDNVNFSQIGTTSPSNLSFIDAGLSQVTYYYYVRACDNANNCGIPSNTASKKPTGRFTSPANLTVSGQPKATNIGPKKATITWTTDRDSDSKVAIGTAPGQYAQQEIGNSTQQPDHQVDLTNLQPGTTYYYVAKWTDTDGNTGVSSEKSFTTLAAPSVGEVSVSGLTNTYGDLTFTAANATKVVVLYGANDNYDRSLTVNTATRSSQYTVRLPDLKDGTKYNYRLLMFDIDGQQYDSNVYSFTTPPRPAITNIRFQPVTDAPKSTLQVSWTTNVATDSRITFGVKGAKQTEQLDAKQTTEHVITMENLQDDKDYTLVAAGTDALGNGAASDVQNFHTALDTRPPKISDVQIESTIRGSGLQARGQIVVSWKTDEPSTSQVNYAQGQEGSLNNKTGEDARLTTEHTVIVSDIPTSSIYRVQPVSRDKAVNARVSDPQTVIIGRGSDNVFSIIYNALQKIFGVKE